LPCFASWGDLHSPFSTKNLADGPCGVQENLKDEFQKLSNSGLKVHVHDCIPVQVGNIVLQK